MWGSNNNVNGIKTDKVATNEGLMGEIDIKAQDFYGFLPKLELISQLIKYKANFSFFNMLLSLFSSIL